MIFDGVRHKVAHVWDQIFSNTIGIVIRLAHNIETQFNSLRGGIAGAFTTIRNNIASAWNMIWRNTVTRVSSGIATVVSWFRGLPGKITAALSGLGTSLYNFATMILGKFLNGLKSAWGAVTTGSRRSPA